MPKYEENISLDKATQNGLENVISNDDLRSEEVTELIGKMPSWIIRRGITLIGIILSSIIVGAYFFKYPDVVTANVIISSSNPPIKLIARSSSPIQRIFVKNNQTVGANETLLLLANAARYDDIQKIEPIVKHLDTAINLYAALQSIELLPALQLGELQPIYTDLYQAVQEYLFFMKHNTYFATIGFLTEQVKYSDLLQHQLNNKELMLREQLKLEHNRFSADSSLVKDMVISKMEYEESKRRMIDQQINTDNNKSTIIEHNLQQTEYKKNIAQIRLQKQTEENALQQKIKDIVRRFNGQYAEWSQKYVIKSPAAGKVTFFKYWKEHQFVTTGEGILMVTPPVQEYIARGTIGTDLSGKIQRGQKVLIKLPAYPYEEYGMLKGRIIERSLVSMDNNFALTIKLEEGLKTNMGKVIPEQPQIEAIGEIITDDKSILQRLFEKVFGKLNEHG